MGSNGIRARVFGTDWGFELYNLGSVGARILMEDGEGKGIKTWFGKDELTESGEFGEVVREEVRVGVGEREAILVGLNVFGDGLLARTPFFI